MWISCGCSSASLTIKNIYIWVNSPISPLDHGSGLKVAFVPTGHMVILREGLIAKNQFSFSIHSFPSPSLKLLNSKHTFWEEDLGRWSQRKVREIFEHVYKSSICVKHGLILTHCARIFTYLVHLSNYMCTTAVHMNDRENDKRQALGTEGKHRWKSKWKHWGRVMERGGR